MLLAFADAEPLAGRLATALQRPLATVDVHRFPDGESLVQLPPELPDEVILCRSLDNPNGKLVELMLAARGARSAGAAHITLAAPYLCYMRQDKAFSPGQVVSQQVIGEFLAAYFDALVTADPHLHRVSTIRDAVDLSAASAVSAAPLVGGFLAERRPGALLLGPDEESEQWVSVAASTAGLDHAVATKTRRGDREVAIALPSGHWRDAEVVLVDDMASSGRTLAQAALALRRAGAARVDAVVTHALFAGDAVETMRAAGIGEIWSSDSITHESNAFSLAPALAGALRAPQARYSS
jgi:ribose-phosphate pyrophosphokinase